MLKVVKLGGRCQTLQSAAQVSELDGVDSRRLFQVCLVGVYSSLVSSAVKKLVRVLECCRAYGTEMVTTAVFSSKSRKADTSKEISCLFLIQRVKCAVSAGDTMLCLMNCGAFFVSVLFLRS